jgi:hypothetical protein
MQNLLDTNLNEDIFLTGNITQAGRKGYTNHSEKIIDRVASLSNLVMENPRVFHKAADWKIANIDCTHSAKQDTPIQSRVLKYLVDDRLSKLNELYNQYLKEKTENDLSILTNLEDDLFPILYNLTSIDYNSIALEILPNRIHFDIVASDHLIGFDIYFEANIDDDERAYFTVVNNGFCKNNGVGSIDKVVKYLRDTFSKVTI